MMQHDLVFTASEHFRIQCLKLFDDRRRLLAGVFEIHSPLGGVRVGVFDFNGPNLQAGDGILSRERLLNPVTVQLFCLNREFPTGEEFGRRVAVVSKRVRRSRTIRRAG